MAVTTPRPVSEVAQARYDEHKAIMSANTASTASLAWKDADEARQQPMVPLNTGKKYVFRSLPGTLRGFSVHIATLPDDFKSDRQRDVITGRFNKKQAELGDVNYDLDRVRDVVGNHTIQFRVIPGNDKRQTTCFYATDDEDVYQFLMSRKRPNKGAWKNIVVEHPTRLVDINGRKVPATYAGAEAALAAIMAEPQNPQE